jgi:septal ring factor EnvC (AmiA/AmiB activator)
MRKNGKTLKVDDIEEQKENLNNELKKVQENLANLENMRVQLEQRNFALSGAIQQCDIFLEYFDVNPTSSIPSQDDSSVSTALS